MEHMQSALDRFTAAWQALSATTLDSGFLTDMINLATSFIETIDTLIDRFGVLGPLITGAFGVSGLMGKGLFKSSNKGIMFGNTPFADIKEAFSTGWDRGKSGDGGIPFIEGFGDAFAELNNKLSKFDRKALDNVKSILSKGEGNYNPADLISAFDGTSDALSDLRTKAQEGRLSLDDLGDAAANTGTSMLKMTAKTLAMNVGIGVLASVITQVAISLFDAFVNGAENASEAAENAFSDASATATQAAENYSSLTELIEQYKTLAAQDTSDPTVRMQIADVQSQINDLVGEEASSIDLVNGNLSEQLGLLNQIQAKQAENYSEAAKDAYNAAKSVEETAYGQQSSLLGLSHYDAMIFGPDAWDLPDDVKKFIEGKSYYQSDIAGFEIDFSSLDTAVEKAQAAREIMDELEKHEGYASTALYRQMSEAYDYYNKMAEDSVAAARTFLESQTQTEMASSNFASILDANAQQFEEARSGLIESLMNNDTISSAIDTGDLNADDIVQYVNTYLSTLDNFSSGYNDWVNEISSLDDIMATSGIHDLEGTGIDESEAQKIDEYVQKISQLKDAYADFNDGELDTSDIEKLKEQFPELNSIMEESGISADNFDDAIMTLLGSMQTDMIDTFNGSIGDVSQMSDEATSRVTMLSNALQGLDVISQAMSFSIDMESETATLNSLNEALAASRTATGLTAEQMTNVEKAFQNLDGYDHAKMFEETANGIRLNTQEYNRLSTALTNGKIDEANSALETMSEELDNLDNQIRQARESGDLTNLDSLLSDREQLRAQINDTAELAAQYQGLASAYKQWQDVESAGNDRDMYESVLSGFETIDDEISRGWLDDGTREYLELLTGKDLSTANIDQMVDAYNQLNKAIGDTGYTIRDFFTVNEEGASTNQGIYNYLEMLDKLEGQTVTLADGTQHALDDLVQRNDSGQIVGFDISVEDQEAIEKLTGFGVEAQDILIRASEDAGFVVNMEGAYTSLADLKDMATQAADYLKEINKTSVDFTFDTSDAEVFNNELTEARKIWESYRNDDGSINFELDGAQEAVDLYSTLVSLQDKMSEPVYMSIDTTKIDDEEIQGAISRMQEYERLTEQKHQIEINGGSVSMVSAEMKDIVNYLNNLDEEVKIQLGIDGMSKEEIEKSLEDGTIEPNIDGTVNLDVEMSDDLKDIRALMMHEAELLSDEELQLVIDADLDTSEVDKYTEDEKEVAVKLIGDIEDFENYTPEEKRVVVDFVKDIDDIENYEPEEKQAVVEFVKDIDNINDYTPSQKEAIVEFVKDVDDISSYTPEEKQAIVEYVLNNTNVQQYTPEQKTALCNFIANSEDIDNYTPEEKAAIVDFLANDADIENYEGPHKEAIVSFLAEHAEVDGYTPEEKAAIVAYLVNDAEVQAFMRANHDTTATVNYTAKFNRTTAPTIYGTAVYTVKSSSAGPLRGNTTGQGIMLDGTAHVNGTANGKAFARGNWATKESGTALVGELGPETVVRNGRFFTIGDNGAEFFKYQKGDIIFNHKQTEELFRNGYVSSSGGRGRAYAEGTAFAGTGVGGLGPAGGKQPSASVVVNNTTNNYNYNTSSKSSSSSSKSSSSSAKKAADEFKESLDWIEIAIDRVERAIDSLDKTATNTFLDFAERDGALLQQMQQVTNEINLQQQAYERYMAEANSVGLSADWQDKIKNGKIDIEVITDEGLKEQISQFQEWYEKALDAKDALDDLNITISELNKQRWDTLIDEFDLYLNRIQNSGDMIEEIVNRAEVDGQIISKNYYTELQNNAHAEAEMLREERERLIALRDEMVNNGSMEVLSDEWYAMNNQIDEITVSIYECQTAWAEYQKAIRETEWEVFDLLQERISGVADEAQFLIDLMSNEKLFEDNGQLTDKGWATMGLYGQQYNVFMNQADRYAEEIKKLEDQMANDPYLTGDGAYNMDVIDRYYELIEAQQEAILSAEQMKDAMKDMVEEGIELELDALDDLIDKYLDALQAQKDLYDYENEIKTDDIAMLEKQLSAYAGDDSEESKATIQELTEQLTEAQRDLQDAEYERQISDVERLLDQMRLDYETILNMRLDNIDMLIEQMIAEINANAGSISETISAEASNVGYTLSDEMQNIWNGANNVLAMYGDQFLSNGTTVATTLSSINTGIQNMISKLDAIAQQKIEEAKKQQADNIPVSKPSTPSTPAPTPSPSPAPSSGGDGVARVGDRVKYVSGSYYYTSGGARPLGYHNRGGYVYITAINSGSPYPYHISTGSRLGSGDLGWLKLEQLSGYAKGKRLIDDDELAWTQENGAEMIVRPSDGAILTPLAKNDSVLNAAATQNIWDMANNPSAFVRDNLGLGGGSVSPATTAGNTNITQNLENVVFSLPNVKNYEELLASMQKDRNFERLINSMTLDKIAGKNSLSKTKAIR